MIHIIDHVLTLPQNISYTAEQAGLSAAAGALMKANLVDSLDSAMNVTVFAPNNAAFQAIGSATANLTMKDLAAILEYHGEHTPSTQYIEVADTFCSRQWHCWIQLHANERHKLDYNERHEPYNYSR